MGQKADHPVGWSVAALGVGTALNPLNSSMVAVALIDFKDDFALTIAQVTWVITVFYLASAALQPVMGRFADRFGPRRLFAIGMGVVVVTCALAPFAPNFALVCLARVFLGVGTSTAFPSAVSMVTEISRRGGVSSTRPLGYVQMANSSAAAFGPVIGGVLVSLAGWQAIFVVNVPLAALGLAGVLLLAPRDAPRPGGGLARMVSDSDFPGILAFSVTLVALLMGVLDALPGLRLGLFALAVVAAGLFTWRELAFRAPFLDLRRLARNRALLLVYAGFAVFTAVYYCAFYGLPQFLEQAAGYDTATVGVMMFPLAAISVLATPVTARAIDRWGVGRVLVVGALGLAVSSALLWVLTASTALVLVLVVTAIMGLPYSIVNIASSQGMYASVRPEDRGVAAGILQTSRYLGAITATALIGVVFGGGVTAASWAALVPVMLVMSTGSVALAWRWKAGEAREAG